LGGKNPNILNCSIQSTSEWGWKVWEENIGGLAPHENLGTLERTGTPGRAKVQATLPPPGNLETTFSPTLRILVSSFI
jgi:hypothetical protein